ncbi:choline dehydrogenase [Xylariaceae sp. FL1651]|nr:choline dehydrogenase [Xylariaceae sp. FL1651]
MSTKEHFGACGSKNAASLDTKARRNASDKKDFVCQYAIKALIFDYLEGSGPRISGRGCLRVESQTCHSNMHQTHSPRYDVIIVGGGVAGLVAAARLSDVAGKRILVIEAGEDHRKDPKIMTPGLVATTWGDQKYDWDFWTIPQVNANSREIPQPRGKGLGGSSAINIMLMVYPSPCNFDIWTNLGNKGWTPNIMKKYFQKVQSLQPPPKSFNKYLGTTSEPTTELYGSSGPISVCYPGEYGPLNISFHEAFVTTGIANQGEPFEGNHLGGFALPNSVTPTLHERSYAEAYYSKYAEPRSNMELLTRTLVRKILLRKATLGDIEAYGVQVSDVEGNFRDIYADEVILAAGALQTPLVLEASGIGSGELLRQHNINVLIDNPAVGENLQDHCMVPVSLEAAPGVTTGDAVRDPAVIQAMVEQYQKTRTGPLAGSPLSLAFVPPVNANGIMTRDEIMQLVKNGDTDARYDAQRDLIVEGMLNPKEATCYYVAVSGQQVMKKEGRTTMVEAHSPAVPGNFITIACGLNQPLSRGRVHITSSDAVSKPLIDPGYLSNSTDLAILSRGVQFIDTIANQPGMQQLLKKKGTRLPAIAHQLHDIKAAEEVVRERLWTMYHLCGTCPMMPLDKGGVVSDRLLVHGTTNIRIIDASVFPVITKGNIQATVYAVAERACDLIKEDWSTSAP